jgi:hypothetical protein
LHPRNQDGGQSLLRMYEGKSQMTIKGPSWVILAIMALVWTSSGAAQADTFDSRPGPQIIPRNTNQATVPSRDHTHPAIAVSHRILDFGSVPVGSSKKLSFTVQKLGAGVVNGGAKVSAPFSILAGSPYALKYPQTQAITVQYAPESMGVHMTAIHLTGGATVTIMGSASPRAAPAPARPRAPAATQNFRLLAGY